MIFGQIFGEVVGQSFQQMFGKIFGQVLRSQKLQFYSSTRTDKYSLEFYWDRRKENYLLLTFAKI